MDSVWQNSLVVLQAFQLAFLLVHDWIPLGPLNDVRAVRKENAVRLLVIGTAVSSAPVVAALWLSLRYFGQPYPTWVSVWLWLTYGLLFAGELQAWWIPYLFGTDAKRRARYQAMCNLSTGRRVVAAATLGRFFPLLRRDARRNAENYLSPLCDPTTRRCIGRVTAK